MSVNKHIIIGNLGKDPEIKTLENGTKLANFSVATTDAYTDKEGNKVTNTEWHNVVLWKKLADVAEMFLVKGSQVYVEGKSKTRSWDDKDGNKKYMTELHGERLQMLGKREVEDKPTPHIVDTTDDEKDDLPF